MQPQFKTNPRRLQQCRVNQQKYRAQAIATTQRLVNRVNELKLETAKLEGQLASLRHTFIPRPIEQSSSLKIAEEYIKAFRYGWQEYGNNQMQYELLNRLLSPTFVLCGRYGYDQLVVQWQSYTKSFNYFEMQCTSIQRVYKDDDEIVHCAGHLIVQLNYDTIRYIFPHLLSNEDIVQKLFNRYMQIPFLVRMTIQNNLIQDMDGEVEFTIGLNTLLKSLKETEEIMSRAMIDGPLLLNYDYTTKSTGYS
ncbi:hypothetical protein THRCLA_07240 [Thraustotheca clavata]|uniref:Bzip transcription factor n=1 Tax=Thraustotheca clavata TaxID=74557 RepID=A0A1V9ZFI3_9STRA|nr:hypothetical protein THRCLA_07240 [Thraustotheca clavata]